MVDLTSNRISIEAKNSNPVVPSSTDGGNISHRDAKFNILVDDLESLITNLEDRITTLETASSGGDSGGDSGTGATTYTYVGDVGSTYINVFTAPTDLTINRITFSGVGDIYNLIFQVESINFNTYKGTTDPVDLGGGTYEVSGSTLPLNMTAGQSLEVTASFGTETAVTIEAFTI